MKYCASFIQINWQFSIIHLMHMQYLCPATILVALWNNVEGIGNSPSSKRILAIRSLWLSVVLLLL